MTRRKAKRIAYGIAYRFVQQALDGGGDEAMALGETDADQKKIEDGLDQIAQFLFERSDREGS